LGSILEQDYKINSININTNKKLGLFGLLHILQDIASEHALNLGFGYESYDEKGFFWVLVRQKVCIDNWPSLGNVITVKTWTTPVRGIYAIREYEIFVNQKKIGACSTTWMILDSHTRRPKMIEDSDNLFQSRAGYSLGFSADKVSLPKAMDSTKIFEVRISDLDMNNHVNNVKYTQWVLDSIPFNYHKTFEVKEYEINFSVETFLEDKIEIFSTINKLKLGVENEVFFKGNRIRDDKTVFTTRILIEPV